jgi:hypothetical protein
VYNEQETIWSRVGRSGSGQAESNARQGAARSSTESAVAASGMRNIKIPDGSIMAAEVRGG